MAAFLAIAVPPFVADSPEMMPDNLAQPARDREAPRRPSEPGSGHTDTPPVPRVVASVCTEWLESSAALGTAAEAATEEVGAENLAHPVRRSDVWDLGEQIALEGMVEDLRPVADDEVWWVTRSVFSEAARVLAANSGESSVDRQAAIAATGRCVRRPDRCHPSLNVHPRETGSVAEALVVRGRG